MQSLPTVEGEKPQAKDGGTRAGLACVRDSEVGGECGQGTEEKHRHSFKPRSPIKDTGKGNARKRLCTGDLADGSESKVTSLQA